MLHTLKKRLYFVVAAYFAFWAKFVLRRWKPRIVVITGSSGKTTLLHLVEAQLGDKAIYSHHANSAVGIPFHILGLEPNVSSRAKWLGYILSAPLHAFRRSPKTKLYIVEADCDRPREGAFTSQLLKPEVTMWISVYNTHSMNFDTLVSSGSFGTHEDAIAYEFGNFVVATTKLVIANGDQPALTEQLKRIAEGVNVVTVSAKALTKYSVMADETVFSFGKHNVYLPGLLPKDTSLSLQMVDELVKYLNVEFDPLYGSLELPPGRSNMLKGINGTTLIDSTYNTGLGATIAVLELFRAYPSLHKWLVIGDILEQGDLEREEHERLADAVQDSLVEHVVLLGKRTHEYTYPLLRKQLPADMVVSFEKAGDVLDYLQKQLKGGEVLLFKGAQGLEGVIEQLLADPNDASRLVRREAVWVKRRQQWGLPQ